MQTIGKRLDEFLIKEDIKRKDFADAISIHLNSLNRIINEDRGIKSTTLASIALEFPILNLSWLLTGNGYYKKTDENIDQSVKDNEDAKRSTANEEREPYLTKNDAELKTKVRTILNNEVVLDAFIEILKRYDK